MSIRLEQAKQEALGKIAGLGESATKFETFIAKNLIEIYANDFIKLLRTNIRRRKVVDSGDLETNIGLDVDEKNNRVTITMLDYFDFPNEGVRGIDFDRNAPGSPYSFKKSKGYYAMAPEGRARIKQMIESGKAKISDTSKTKQPIGLEKKRKSIADMQTDQLIYLIRKHGIKRTDYFNDAFDTVFGSFKEDIAQAYGQDVAINIRTISKTK